MATYDEYYNDMLRQAAKRQVAYEKQREQEAQTAAAQVRDTYARLDEAAVTQYTQAAEETEAAYRDVYDANAINELVARRNIEETMRNRHLTNSGLSRTEQTAISLQRGRADTETTRQKQAAVDSIMRELDALRSEYGATSAQKQADIHAKAADDVASYALSVQEDAEERAYSLYKQDLANQLKAVGNEEEDDVGATETAVPTLGTQYAVEGKPSRTAVRVDAIKILREQGVVSALKYLEGQRNNGVISEAVRFAIIEELAVKERAFPTADEVKNEAETLLKEQGVQAAQEYLDVLHDSGLIKATVYEELCLLLGI